MNICNHTPFSPFTFETVDLNGDRFQIVVVRGTFDIVPNERLRAAKEQDDIKAADEFYAKPGESSLRYEDDLAPFKARSDITVNATAYAPAGEPSKEWMVGVKVGKLHKRLMVTGPRFWLHQLIGEWSLSAPEPTASVPLTYENAYGGSWYHEDDAGAYERNPVGCGYVCKKHLDKSAPLRAPSIVSPEEIDVRMTGEHVPQGFGPIAKPWLPRRGFAGTYDESWKKDRYPHLPEDFNPLFYNCAHPDMIYEGYLRGDEEARLERLHAEHEVLPFTLPGIRIVVAGEDHSGFRYATIARLDTLHIDADELRAYLIWRAPLLLMEDGMAKIDVVMRDQWPELEHLDAAQRERQLRSLQQPD